jgi:hypothetical protein
MLALGFYVKNNAKFFSHSVFVFRVNITVKSNGRCEVWQKFIDDSDERTTSVLPLACCVFLLFDPKDGDIPSETSIIFYLTVASRLNSRLC